MENLAREKLYNTILDRSRQSSTIHATLGVSTNLLVKSDPAYTGRFLYHLSTTPHIFKLYNVIWTTEGYNLLMTPFYTRTGDDGFTGLLGEGRVPKYHPRTEAVGTLDEATAALGIARASCQADQSGTLLVTIQRDLYKIMAEVSATPETAEQFRTIGQEQIDWLETHTDAISHLVEMPQGFILPGDSPAGAMMSLARTIVRRAERQIAQLLHSGEIDNQDLLRYLNRLSSLCFAMELLENKAFGQTRPTLAKGSSTP
jgi:cob(I)alamin adenosyltransferase